MLTAEDHHRIFKGISSSQLWPYHQRVKGPIYAVGGSALILSGLKDKTKDVDVAIPDVYAHYAFIRAAENVGYHEKPNPCKYNAMRGNGHATMIERKGDCIDVFREEIGSAFFTRSMAKRAINKFNYGNIELYVTNPNDVFLLKATTLREKDENDLMNIASNYKLDWDMMVYEARSWQYNCEAALDCISMAAKRLSDKGIQTPASLRTESIALRAFTDSV